MLTQILYFIIKPLIVETRVDVIVYCMETIIMIQNVGPL